MKIGLLLGSYNPVHCGHIMLANYCLSYAGVDEVWLVLSPHNPLKDSTTLHSVEQRLAWLRAATAAYSLPIKVCEVELTLPSPSYTINTLEALARGSYSANTYSIIMGADSLATIERWKDYRRILNNYEIVVYPRLGVDAISLCNMYGTRLLDAPIIAISSTMLRRAACEGKDLSAYLPCGVNFFNNNNNPPCTLPKK